jgi:Uma2 family endonuclease
LIDAAPPIRHITAMAITLENPLVVKENVTVAEYEAMPEDGHQYQLIHGQLIMSPGASWNHQGIELEIAGELRSYLKKNRLGKVRITPLDVFLGPHVLQPDILYVSNENSARVSRKGVTGAPDLVAEILSPSTARQDLKIKRDIYEVFGVRECWFIDPVQNTFQVLRLVDGEFHEAAVLKEGDFLTTPLLPGFSLDVAAVLAEA